MSEISKAEFLRNFSKAILENEAALFVGAGISVGAGFVDWRGLLREIANDLKLKVDEEHDLIAVAQYEFNRNQNRARLNRKIVEEFRDRAKLSEVHRAIARLPIDTIWTTNYDRLLEKAYADEAKVVDVKHSTGMLLRHTPYADVILYKMHGDVEYPDDAVLIKDDYERYQLRRELFSNRLQGDLTWRQFLFLGFSFTDPNIDYVFSRLRCLLEQNAQNQPARYCVLRKPSKPKKGVKNYAALTAAYDRDKRLLPHRIADLARFNIDVVLIDEYVEITELLHSLVANVCTKNVFVSGSAHDFDPVGRDRLEKFGRKLGAKLIESGYNLVSGFGLGISGSCIIGAHEQIKLSNAGRLGQRLRLHPFPQNFADPAERKLRYTEIRTELTRSSGASIFIAGNKLDPTSGKTVMADGLMEEFALAKHNHHVLIPIPATGWAAAEIWKQMQPQLEKLHPAAKVRKHFAVLADLTKSEDDWVAAILAIIDASKKA
jgi:hypothetical protein